MLMPLCCYNVITCTWMSGCSHCKINVTDNIMSILSSGQTTLLCTSYCNIVRRKNMVCAFGHRVAMHWFKMLGVGSSLKMVKFEPTMPNMSQQGGQMHTTCCTHQCCNMLRCHVAIVCLGLYVLCLRTIRLLMWTRLNILNEGTVTF